MFESLRSLSDSQIASGSLAARAQEHSSMLASLGYLVETERRQLHLQRGYSSLFDYCTRELGYSESQASRRTTAARCIVRFPDVFPLLKRNEINLSTLSRVSRILTPENCAAVLARIRRMSLREVEAIAAEYEPAAVFPRDRVRTVVARVPVTRTVALGQNHLRYDGKKSASACESAMEPQPVSILALVPISPPLERRKRVEFTAHETLMTKLDRIRSLASHRLSANASLDQLLDFMADYFLTREDPVARQKRRDARNARPPVSAAESAASHATPTTKSRHVAARVRDEVLVRDRQRCAYVGPDGTRCGSTHVLQIDHITPVARGGDSSIDNLRVLCAYHNRLEAERLMGRCGPPERSHAR